MQHNVVPCFLLLQNWWSRFGGSKDSEEVRTPHSPPACQLAGHHRQLQLRPSGSPGQRPEPSLGRPLFSKTIPVSWGCTPPFPSQPHPCPPTNREPIYNSSPTIHSARIVSFLRSILSFLLLLRTSYLLLTSLPLFLLLLEPPLRPVQIPASQRWVSTTHSRRLWRVSPP